MKRTILLLIPFSLILIGCEGETATKEVEQVETTQEVTVETDPIDVQLKSLNEQIKNDINNPNLYAERANLFLQMNDLSSSSADIQRALRIDSLNFNAYIALGDLQAMQGQFEPTKYAFELAYKNAKTDQERSLAYQKIGEIYYVIQDYDKALDYADLSLKENLFNAESYFLKGLLFEAKGNVERAISSWQTAVEQEPDHVKSYLRLALTYDELNDPLVIDYTNNILDIDSNNVEALYTQAMYQQRNDLLNEAMKNYTRIMKINPNMREAPYNMGYIHLVYLKLYNEAKGYFEKSIKIDPNYHEAYYNYGYCFELLGDIQNAEKIYKKALSVKPDYTAAAKGLSRLNDTRTINE
jgi:tetratricopeptide (TPR) repeat protein